MRRYPTELDGRPDFARPIAAWTRRQLAWRYGATLLAVALVMLAGLFVAIRVELVERAVERAAAAVLPAVHVVDGQVVVDRTFVARCDDVDEETNVMAVRVRRADGTLVATYGPPLPPPILPPRHEPVDLRIGGHHLRRTAIVLGNPARPAGYLTITMTLDQEELLLRQLSHLVAWSLPLVALVCGLAGLQLAARTTAPLEDAVERMRRFTADAAHELRTPLATLRVHTDLLVASAAAGQVPDAARLAVLDQETGRLQRLTEDLLFLSRHERRPSERVAFDLEEVLGDLVHFLEPVAEERGIALSVQMARPLPCVGAPDDLARAFRNLLDNALKYTPAGGQVSVRASVVRGELEVEVADTGVGIPAAELPRLFDRFYRAEPARSGSVPGHGLGLAIASAIVQGHGGRIEVQSLVGAGTVFTVQLPAAVPAQSLG